MIRIKLFSIFNSTFTNSEQIQKANNPQNDFEIVDQLATPATYCEVEELKSTIEALKLAHQQVSMANESLRIEKENLTAEKTVLIEKNKKMEAEKSTLEAEVTSINESLFQKNLHFEFRYIENSDYKVFLHTGLPSKSIFNILFETMDALELTYCMNWTVHKVPKKDQLLMTLMKLRMDLRNFDLAERFGVSHTTVSNIFRTWVLALHEIFFVQLMANIPSRHKNQTCLPSAFATFENCRIVLDCCDTMSDAPINMRNQRLTFSHYKHYNSWKILVGISPNGVITYVSKLYPGSFSDKKIVAHCGIVGKLTTGDMVMADKGFLIDDILPAGVSTNLPPFLHDSQFTPAQVRKTEEIARARVHVERAICRLKNFRMTQYIPSELFAISTEIFQVKMYTFNI